MMQQSGRLQTGAGGVSRVHLQGQAATALPAAVHRFVAPRLQCSRLAHTWRHGVAVSPVGGPGPRLVLASVAATSTSQVADDDELPEASTLGKLAELFAEAMNEQALQQEEVTETVYQIKDEEMFNTINKMISEVRGGPGRRRVDWSAWAAVGRHALTARRCRCGEDRDAVQQKPGACTCMHAAD